MSVYRKALYLGVAAGTEHEPLLRSIECKTVIDVGANRGQFALAARRCFPTAKIISFEPLNKPRQSFAKIFSADNNVQLHAMAIGREIGEHVIHVAERDDSSSLLPITARQSELFPGTAEASLELVRIATLDTIVSASEVEGPALLKLDVQGFEIEALQGCELLIDAFRYVYVECSFVELYEGQALADQVIAHLAVRGFKLSGVYNLSCDKYGVTVQADFFFTRHPNESVPFRK